MSRLTAYLGWAAMSALAVGILAFAQTGARPVLPSQTTAPVQAGKPIVSPAAEPAPAPAPAPAEATPAETSSPVRQSFEIASGPAASESFAMAERLSTVISHPPGLTRCKTDGRCGPSGLIAAARATESLAINLVMLEQGQTVTALIPAPLLLPADWQKKPNSTTQGRLRAILALEEETIVLVAAKGGPVRSLPRLRGRWFGIDLPGTSARAAAMALLQSAGMDLKAVRPAEVPANEAAQLMRAKRIDAFVVSARHVPPVVLALLSDGVASLVPLEGSALDALKATGVFQDTSIVPPQPSQGVAPGGSPEAVAPIRTLKTPIVWAVKADESEGLIHAVTRAAFNDANRSTLDEGESDFAAVRPRALPRVFPVALHGGAARYLSETGRLSN